MALRVRSRAPQDENAAMPHLSGKIQMQGSAGMGMAGKSGGLKAQQQQGGNPERKKLSNITNTLKPAGAKLSDSENSSSKASSAASVKKAPAARIPLRNITNEGAAASGPSPSPAPLKELKQAKPKPKPAAPKTEAPKPWAKYSAPLADPEMEKLVQAWAEEGIEQTAGATGDELDALRRQREDQEIEERVAAIRAYRMPLPSFLYHYDDSAELQRGLELDAYEKCAPSGVPEPPFPEMDWGTTPGVPVDESLVYVSPEDDIPSIPEDWHLVKSLPPAPKPVPRRPAARTSARTWL